MDVRNKFLNLRSVRKSKGFTAAAVAMAVGMSSDRYIRIEKNEIKTVLPHERAMICSFFQMSEDALFRMGCESYGGTFPGRVRRMPCDEIEKMLAAEYGDKLKPNKKTPQGS